MKVLISSATALEVQPLINEIIWQPTYRYNVRKARWGLHDLYLLISGPGLMQMAYHLGALMNHTYFDLAINMGVSGCFHQKWPLGSVVNVVSQQIGDLGAEDGDQFIPIKDLSFFNKNTYPYKEGILHNRSINDSFNLKKIPTVTGISVNKISGEAKNIQQLKDLFQPDVESMEGAAFFYACLMNRLPFLEIKSISNYVEERNKENWDLPLAIGNVNNFILEFLNSLLSVPVDIE